MVQYARRNAERQSNLCVAAPTTPAQLFHVLRRQMNRPFAQPLVLMTPKRLHVHKPATSALQDFVPGSFFNRVIDDSKACSPFLMEHAQLYSEGHGGMHMHIAC